MLSLTSPRHTSTLATPAVCFAQIAAIAEGRAEWVKPTPERTSRFDIITVENALEAVV
jgi:hypothetical protein